jgi:diacylglycerol kinase (ATP)
MSASWSGASRSCLFKDVKLRLLEFLMDLAQEFGRTRDGGIHISHTLTQSDIAMLIGTSRKTASLLLNELEDDGLIRHDRRHIFIPDMKALESAVAGQKREPGVIVHCPTMKVPMVCRHQPGSRKPACPAAGGKRSCRGSQKPALQCHLNCDSPHTAGHIPALVHDAIAQGFTHLISVGGDGTHHECINGILAGWCHSRGMTLAIFSAGTGNDWATMHGISTRTPDAWVGMFLAGHMTSHSAGHISYTLEGTTRTGYFINVAGMALDGRVVETLPSIYKKIPLLPGYLIAGIRHLLTYRAPHLEILADGVRLTGKFITVHAGICKYSGGGMQFVPHAHPDAGDLACTAIEDMPLHRLLMKIPLIYNGRILSHPQVHGLRGTRIIVTAPDGTAVPLEADGEFLGYTPVAMSIVPQAFSLIVPPAKG